MCAPQVLLIAALLGHAAQSATEAAEVLLLTDFTQPDFVWRNIDDAVMGGVSRSRFTTEDGVGVFAGEVSLKNNGGFASVRTDQKALDLSAYAGLLLRVRTDARHYRFRLRMTEAFDGVSYEATLPAAAAWRTLRLPFSAFLPVFRGNRVLDAPPLDPAKIRTLGVLIADKQAGEFRLELDWIKAYPASQAQEPSEVDEESDDRSH